MGERGEGNVEMGEGFSELIIRMGGRMDEDCSLPKGCFIGKSRESSSKWV